jgi:hypothetical protein
MLGHVTSDKLFMGSKATMKSKAFRGLAKTKFLQVKV